MGSAIVAAAVADAGPLIHLAEIEALELLLVFDRLHVPDAVWSETVGQGRIGPEALRTLPNVRRHTVPVTAVESLVRENKLEHLQAGECECLCLGRRIGVSVLLTDDLAVRDAAKRLGLTPVGSLGVVVRAYQQGRIVLPEARRHLDALYTVSSLFVTRAIVDLALEHLVRVAGPAD